MVLLELSTISILRDKARAVQGERTAMRVCGKSEMTNSTKRKMSSTVVTMHSGSKLESSKELSKALSFVMKKLKILLKGSANRIQHFPLSWDGKCD